MIGSIKIGEAPQSTPAIINWHEPDECCGKLISRALRTGALDHATLWACPKCGLEWKPEHLANGRDTIRHWRPHVEYGIVPMSARR